MHLKKYKSCLKSWDSKIQHTPTAKLPSLQDRRGHMSLCHLYKIINCLTDLKDAPMQPKLASMKTVFTVPQSITQSYKSSFFPSHSFHMERSAQGSVTPLRIFLGNFILGTQCNA